MPLQHIVDARKWGPHTRATFLNRANAGLMLQGGRRGGGGGNAASEDGGRHVVDNDSCGAHGQHGSRVIGAGRDGVAEAVSAHAHAAGAGGGEVLQLRNICDAVSLQLQHVEAVWRAKLRQALQRHDAVAGKHEQLQLQQRLQAVRVLQPVGAQVEVSQLRARV